MREYIMRYEDDVLQLLPDKIQPLIRCKDCIYGDVPNLVYRKYNIYCARYEIFHNRDFYCADGERKDGDGDG